MPRLAREEEGGGATKAYEVPPELLVLARANKAKRAAARRSPLGASSDAPDSASLEASTRPTVRPPAGDRAPSVVVAESDLASPGARTSERAEPAAVAAARSMRPVAAVFPPEAAAGEPLNVSEFRRGARRKRVTRWMLIAACAIAVCAGSVLGGKLIRDHQLLTLPVLHF